MRRLLALVCGGFAALTGCAVNMEFADRDEGSAGGSGTSLQVDGTAIDLGQSIGGAMQLPVFVAQFQRAVVSGRADAPRELVERFPELAERVVLSDQADGTTRQAVAIWLDGLASPSRGGWSALATDRDLFPDRYAGWEESRATRCRSVRRGEFESVFGRDGMLPEGSPAPWPAFDDRMIRGMALLSAGLASQAVPEFHQAAKLASGWDSRVAVRAELMEALALRTAGDPAQAEAVRSRVVSGLSLHSVHDPLVLRMLLDLGKAKSGPDAQLSPRSVRWRLGRLQLRRNSPQAALLSWRAAESDPGSEPSIDRLRLGQAEALFALDVEEPAIAMLVGLADSSVRSEALVMLGLAQLRRGQYEPAIAVLREAVEATSSSESPQVYADVGLAMLSAGNQKMGLSLLHEARDAYAALGDLRALRQLLENELRYARAIGDPDLASQVRRGLREAGM